MKKLRENSEESNFNSEDWLFPWKEFWIILALAIAVFWGGYFIWFCSGLMGDSAKENLLICNAETFHAPYLSSSESKNIYLTDRQFSEIKQTLEEIKRHKKDKHEEYLSVSTLNGFYSSLFTAIAVVLAIVALISWKSFQKQFNRNKLKMAQIEQAIKDYNKVKSDVGFLLKRNEYATRVQEIVEFDENSKVSYKMKLSEQDIKELKEIKDFILNEHETTAWLEIFIAHDLIFNDDNIDQDDLDDAEKIYKYNESRNLFKPNSEIEPYLYHFMGELYHAKFKKYIENHNNNNVAEIDEAVHILEDSKNYYSKSMNVRIEKEKLQTRANLAVVLIDMAKLEMKRLDLLNKSCECDSVTGKEIETKINEYLQDANDKLILVKDQKPDFNTYWDLARVEYYLKKRENLAPLLRKAAEMITFEKEKQIFINRMREELEEFKGHGFPGDTKLIENTAKFFNERLLQTEDLK